MVSNIGINNNIEYTTKWSKGLLGMPSRYVWKEVVNLKSTYKYDSSTILRKTENYKTLGSKTLQYQ